MNISSTSSSTNVFSIYATSQSQQPVTLSKALQQASIKDTVSISSQAQRLASDGDTMIQEMQETGAEKASEAARNKA